MAVYNGLDLRNHRWRSRPPRHETQRGLGIIREGKITVRYPYGSPLTDEKQDAKTAGDDRTAS